MDGDRLVNQPADPSDILALPPAARMRERLTKVLLSDAASDLGIDIKIVESAVDVASAVVGIIRPETAQVPAGRHGRDVVGDIPVIHLVLTARATRPDRNKLVELVHRSMARPVILFVSTAEGTDSISVALTHVSPNDAGRSVIDARALASLDQIVPGALRFAGLDGTDLATYYRDLTRVVAAQGRPTAPGLAAEEVIRMRNELSALEVDLASTIRAARNERSQSGRIALNTRARELREQIRSAEGALFDSDPSQRRRSDIAVTSHEPWNTRKQDS